jgi:hypothetical protein
MYARNVGNRRDVIQATFVQSGETSRTGITASVEYIVSRVSATLSGTTIPLPTFPRGDVQVTINGVALTKGTAQFVADYIVDPYNSSGSTTNRIIIQNQDVIAYLRENPVVQVAYIEVKNNNSIAARSEVVRVDSFNSSKIYYNQSANKYVYKMNYKANDAKNIKVLVDGVALEPNMDYTINVQNLYEIFLPKGIRYGSIISVYYIVGTEQTLFSPMVNDIFDVGDISKLSFLEFMELIQRKMINVRNRKTISDFKGGWYPSLERIYLEYMRRSLIPIGDPLHPNLLHSNGYTFANLYPFLSKYNAFFQKFVDELLPATIILRKSGLMVRNSIFTKQKFMYRRGVNLYASGSTTLDKRGHFMVEYLGNDSSMFLINQKSELAPLFVKTKTATFSASTMSLKTGGINISGYPALTSYGMAYRILNSGSWKTKTASGSLPVNNFSMTITGITYGTSYEYKAFVVSGTRSFTGDTLQIAIPVPPAVPVIHTKAGTPTYSGITNTGGNNIVGYADIDYYGMQYRPIGATSSNISVSATTLNFSATTGSKNVKVSGDSWNTTSISTSAVWIKAPTTVAPSLLLNGTIVPITATTNTNVARTGTVTFTPNTGTVKTVTVNQSGVTVSSKVVTMPIIGTGTGMGDTGASVTGQTIVTPSMVAGEDYTVSMCWRSIHNGLGLGATAHKALITCNGIPIYSDEKGKKAAQDLTIVIPPFSVLSGDVIKTNVDIDTSDGAYGTTCMEIMSITSGIGNFIKGSPSIIDTETPEP